MRWLRRGKPRVLGTRDIHLDELRWVYDLRADFDDLAECVRHLGGR